MFNIIFFITCYPVLFLMYFMLRNAKDKNNFCFGASLSPELKNAPEIEKIDKWYRKNLKTSTIILAFIPFTTIFFPHMSIQFAIWMVWILVVCILPEVWFARANKKVQDFKKEKGWEEKTEVSYTDLRIAGVPRKVNFLSFFPALFFATVPSGLAIAKFGFGEQAIFTWLVITFTLCTFIFYLAAAWTDKQKVPVISEDSTINMNYARANKQIWKSFWLKSTWATVAFTWFCYFCLLYRQNLVWGFVGASVVYSIVIMIFTYVVVEKLGEISKKYQDKITLQDYSDDDSCWPFGLFYYNKKDTHIFVQNRMGTGMTMNMATKIGIGTYIFAILILLIIPISIVWLLMLDFTQIDTRVENNVIICEHLSVEYEIPLEEIDSYEVITELPEMMKVNGNGMDHVYSGTFEIWREGNIELFLNPQNETYIKLYTDDETYIISGADEAATKQLLEQLNN